MCMPMCTFEFGLGHMTPTAAIADVELPGPGVARRGGPQALALAQDPEGGQGSVLDRSPR